MNKKLAPAILLAFPLVSLAGPAFAAETTTPTNTESAVVLQVNETDADSAKAEKTEKAKKTEQATKKVARTDQKAADKVAKTQQQAEKQGTEKAASKAAEKVAKTEQKAADKIAKTKEKAGLVDEAPEAPVEEAPVVEPKTVTVSFIDMLNNQKMVFANGGSPVLTVVDGDEKTVYEDTDLNGIYGDEDGKKIALTADSVLTVNLPDGSLLDLVTYKDVDGNFKEVPLDNILKFDYEALKDGANEVTVYAEFPQDNEWDIPVMTMAAVASDEEVVADTETAKVEAEADTFQDAPVRTDNNAKVAAAAQAAVVAETPKVEEAPAVEAAPEVKVQNTDSSEIAGGAAETDEYDLQIDLTEPVDEASEVADATESNLEGAQLTIDDEAPVVDDSAIIIEEEALTDDAVVVADEEAEGVIVADGPEAVLADTGAGVFAAGFGGLLAALGGASLLFRRKKADA